MIADVLNDYLVDCGDKQSQPNVVAGRVLKLLDFWGARPVSAITPATVKAYGLASGVGPGTLKRELGILRAALNYSAEKLRRLKDAPFIPMPETPPGRDRWLTRSEAARLLWETRNTRCDTRAYLGLYVRLALYTGARPGALLDLRWPQVRFSEGKHGVIDFNPPGRVRTSKGRPRVPMTPAIHSMLLRAKATHGSDLGPVINRRGESLGDLGMSFARAVERAGMETDGPDKVTPHTLRHTCGSWLAQRGVDLFKIGRWLGHSAAKTTELYAHLHPDDLADVKAAKR